MGLYAPLIRAQEDKEETLAETPATVSVLTRDDFLLCGWLNVANALASVPGMYVSWGRDTYYPGVRGVSIPRDAGTRSLVLFIEPEEGSF